MSINDTVYKDAPADGQTYGRKDGQWSQVTTSSGGGGSTSGPISPDFTYDVNGTLTRIDYPTGEYKTFTYSGDFLVQIDFFQPSLSIINRKQFYYQGDELDFIIETNIAY